MKTHTHIPLENGHITWTGKELPSNKVMQAFSQMARNIKENSKIAKSKK